MHRRVRLLKRQTITFMALQQPVAQTRLETLFEYNTGTSAFTKLMDFSTLGGFRFGYTSLLEVCVKPSTPGSISSSTTALCEGSSSSLTFVATVATATSYAWSLPQEPQSQAAAFTNTYRQF